MATLDDLPELLTVPEVAKYLGVGPESVRRLVRSGRLVAVFIGRAWKIPKDELQAFLERNKGVPPKRSRRATAEASGPVELAGGRVHPGRQADDDDDNEVPDSQLALFDGRRGRSVRIIG